MEVVINSEDIKRFGAIKEIFDKIPDDDFSQLEVISTGNFEYFCIQELREYFEKRNSMIKSFTFSSELKICPQFSGYVFAKEYILLEGTEEISEFCFLNQKIEKLVIPKTVNFIGENSFYNAEIKFIECNDNPFFEWSNEKLLNSFTGLCLYDVNRKIYDFTNGKDRVVIPAKPKSIFDKDFWVQKKEEFITENKQRIEIQCDYEDIKEKLLTLPFKQENISFLHHDTVDSIFSRNEHYNEAYLYLNKQRFLERCYVFELCVQERNEDTKNEKSLLYKIKCSPVEGSSEFDLIIGFIIRDGNIDIYIPYLAHFVTFSEKETGFVIPYIYFLLTNLDELFTEINNYSNQNEKKKQDKYEVLRQKRLADFNKPKEPEEIFKDKLEQIQKGLEPYKILCNHQDNNVYFYKQRKKGSNLESRYTLELTKEQILFCDPKKIVDKIAALKIMVNSYHSAEN